MSANLLDATAYPLSGASRERWVASVTFTITAAGAIGTTVADDAKLAGDTFASGVCALTFPACTTARFQTSLVSAAGTVQEVVVTALSASAGTATVKTTTAGVATEPASGDVVMIRIFGTVDAS